MYASRILVAAAVLLLLSPLACAPDRSREGQQSAAAATARILDEQGIDAALTEFEQTIQNNDKYAVTEEELTALGHKLLRAGRIATAIEVFRMTVGVFPPDSRPARAGSSG